MREAEALEPEEPEQSHLIAGSGDGEEWWTTFLEDEVQGACGRQQRLEGVGFLKEAEAPEPEEPQQSHLIAGSGDGEEWWTTFQGHEMRGACGSQQRLESWEQCDPVRKQEGVGFMREAEALDPEEPEQSHVIAGPGGGEEWWTAFQGHETQGACGSQQRLEGVEFQRETENLMPEGPEQSLIIAGSGDGEEWWTTFQGHEMQGAYGSQQRLEGWEQFDPVRRDSCLHNPAVIEGNLSRREVGVTECEENLRQRSDLPRRQSAPIQKETHTCSECGKIFFYKSCLIKHEKYHRGEKPYMCAVCGISFSQERQWAKHERGHNPGKKTDICSQCGKAFSSRDALHLHQNIHTGKKRYSCLECGESFHWNNQLMAHSVVHTGELPFKCSQCERKFKWQNNLQKHMKTHEKEGL